MSNLSDFFGGSGDAYATITGQTALSDIAAGDGLRLADGGVGFANKLRSAMKGPLYSVAYNTAPYNTTRGSYTTAMSYRPGNNNATVAGTPGCMMSNGYFLDFGWGSTPNPTSQTNAITWATYSTTNNTLSMVNVTDVTATQHATSGSNANSFYYYQNAHYVELENDGTVTYVAALLGYKTYSQSYYRTIMFILKVQNSNGTILNVTSSTNAGLEGNYMNPWDMGRGGAAFMSATGSSTNYLVWAATGLQNSTSAAGAPRLQIHTMAYNKSAPGGASVSTAFTYSHASSADYQEPTYKLIVTDAANGEALLIMHRQAAVDTFEVYKVVLASNGAVTVTSQNAATPVSNFTTAGDAKYSHIVPCSQGTNVKFALVIGDGTTMEMQRYACDFNASPYITESGGIVSVSSPKTGGATGTNVAFTSGNNASNWQSHVNCIAKSATEIYFNKGVALSTSVGDDQWFVKFNANTGEISGQNTSILGLGGTKGVHSTSITIGANKVILDSNASVYGPITYDIFDLGFFTHSLQTEKAVGVALNAQTAGSTGLQVGLFPGATSSVVLPANAFASKNGEYYALKVAGSALNEEDAKNRFKGKLKTFTPSDYGADAGAANWRQNISQNWYNTYGDLYGGSTYQRTHRFSGTIANNATWVEMFNVTGKGALVHGPIFSSGYNGSSGYHINLQLVIDGVVVWHHGVDNSTTGIPQTWGYNYPNYIPAEHYQNYLPFEESLVWRGRWFAAGSTFYSVLNIIDTE